jgi:hypothetical protein
VKKEKIITTLKRVHLYIRLFDRPVVLGSIITWLWYQCHTRNLLGLEAQPDDAAMISGAITALGTIWAVYTAIIMFRIDWELREIAKAIQSRNYRLFKALCGTRTHPAHKILITTLTLILVYQFFLFQHVSTFVGGSAVFWVSFAPAIYIEIANDLDTPLRGIWNVTIPPEWVERLKRENHES